MIFIVYGHDWLGGSNQLQFAQMLGLGSSDFMVVECRNVDSDSEILVLYRSFFGLHP